MKKVFKYLGYAAVATLVARKEHKKEEGEGPAPAAGSQDTPPQTTNVIEHRPDEEVPKGAVPIVKRTFSDFMDDDCMSLGATVAYYTVFSLPPLLLLLISIAGMVFGREAVQHHIQEQISGMIGTGAAGQVQTMVQSASAHPSSGVLGLVFGIAALIFGATGCFIALQDALNKAWHVKPDPKVGGVKAFIGKRLLSFGVIVSVGFLLLVSLAVSAALSAFGGWVAGYLSSSISAGLLHVAGEVFSFAVIWLMFAGILKFLPDAKIEWRQVWVGSFITALLFTIGKMLIGLYLGKSGAASAYGAAGSLMLIVLWLYYASLIFLMGAEFTKVWALSRGHGIEPEEGAVRVVTQERHEK
jgi:membrane protein